MANGENLGSINYSVDVDYSALIAAGQAQDQFTQKARETASEMTKYKYVTSTVTKEYRALKASIDPAYKAQQQFAAGADLIQKELNSGRITLSQYSKDMANLRATTRATAQVGGMFRSSIGGVGTIAQQAGYQIGDFATQVASGQSAMMAFTQQAPQFAGAFGPGGAVLGAVLAIGGAVAGAFVRGMGEGEEATKSLREQIDELNLSFDELTDNQREALQLERGRARSQAEDQIRRQKEELEELRKTQENLLRLQQMGREDSELGAVFNQSDLDRVNDEITELAGKIDTAEAKAKNADEELDELLSGKGRRGATEEIEALNDSLAFQVEVYGMSERAIALAEIAQLEKNGADEEAVRQARSLTNALYDQIDAEKARQEAVREAEEARRRATQEAETLQRQIDQLLGKADPLSKFAAEWEKVQQGLAGGLIGEDQAEMIMDYLIDVGQDAGKKAAEEFENPWQKTADNVASGLQDAIASGDWDKIGDAIGNSLATSIAGIVNKTITDSLAKDLTSNSSALAQIGGAFAGPIAGAVAGGAIQLAVSELSDYFSDDWDPTEARQAAQGTGTVLGSIDAKSESIAKAVDISANASRELVGINRDMLRALQTVQLGIGGASARVARGQGAIDIPGISVDENFFSNFGMVGDAFSDSFDAIGQVITLGLFDSLGSSIGKLIGGKSRQVDEGVQIIGGYISDLIDETIVNSYATFRVKKHAFSSTKTKERFQRIGGDVEQQFSLVFESLLDSVVAGADILGVDAMGRLEGFKVATQRLSLEDLSAEQQQAELEAYFGTVFDQLAMAAIPFLDDFQKAGEGLGETLARVATQVSVTQEAVNMLGLRFSTLAGAELVRASDRLIEMNGGLEQFISNMQNFIGNFATESQQFVINANALTNGMGDLPLPQTREGFWQLMQAQDAATEEGARNIATLLRLQGTADQYYSAMEKAQTEYYQTEIQGQQQRLTEAQRANRAVQSAMDAMLFQSSAVQEASRQGALRTLEQIANSGRVNNIGQLQSALDAATQLDTGRYSTFADYAREYARTAGVVGRVSDVTQQAEDREARMLRSLENQLEAVKGMRNDLERSQLAIIKQTNKTAKVLERFEIDGIEVRS